MKRMLIVTVNLTKTSTDLFQQDHKSSHHPWGCWKQKGEGRPGNAVQTLGRRFSVQSRYACEPLATAVAYDAPAQRKMPPQVVIQLLRLPQILTLVSGRIWTYICIQKWTARCLLPVHVFHQDFNEFQQLGRY